MKFKLAIIAGFILLAACKKEKPEEIIKKEEGVEITLKTITEGSKIASGSDTSIQVYLSDKLSLHEYTVEVTDSTGYSWFYEEGHSHLAEILLAWPWKNLVPTGTSLYLHVKASNHAGIVSEKKVKFQSVS